ncbi:MAG: glycosyltransferase family 4 protein [Planctomycetota bacterium]
MSDRALTITFVCPPANLSGGVRVIAVYAASLARRGHRVRIVTVPYRQRSLKWKLKDWSRGRFDVRRPEPSHLDDLDAQRLDLTEPSQLTAARVGDADVLVTTLWTTAVHAARLPAACGRQVHFVQHDERVVTPMLAEQVAEAWRLPGPRLVVSPWLAEVAHEEFEHNDVELCPNGVDLELFHPLDTQTSRTQTVGMMYSRAAFKGADIAIDAVRRHRAAIGASDGLRLITFGHETPGDAHADVIDAFEHRPAQARIAELYRSCDAWLYPSRCEGFGLPVLEAMASGTPVIGTDAGVGREAIEPGGGWRVDVDDPGAMAEAMNALTTLDDAAWRDRRRQARATAEGYAWPALCDRFESALRRVADSRSSVTGGTA